MDGYLILQRQVMEALEEHDGNVMKVYLACQRRAAFKDQEVLSHAGKSNGNTSYGSLMIYHAWFAKELRMTHKQIRYAFSLLFKLEFIQIKTAPKWTIITLLGYGSTVANRGHTSAYNVAYASRVQSLLVDKNLKFLSTEIKVQRKNQNRAQYEVKK